MHEMNESQSTGVILVSIQTPGASEAENEASLLELEKLNVTLGYQVYGKFTQKKAGYGSPTVLGEGKLQEIAETLFALNQQGKRVHHLVFDRELSPLQSRNVESIINEALGELDAGFEVEATDRTGIIIDIFSRHARTRQARLQIEIARLKYISPRLRDKMEVNGDRQAGGVGGKGAGETQMELKRRHLRDRLADLRRELEDLEIENDNRRQKREAQSVALVGYTNAGKSSLMKGLTGGDIYVADKLFATLDVTTRQMEPPVIPTVLITDTVGFVQYLPHDLVASFKSTLSEVHLSDFLLHVVDGSDSQFVKHIETTEIVLKEMKVEISQMQLVFNKIDKMDFTQLAKIKEDYPQAWFVSALNSESILHVREKLVQFFEARQTIISVFIPFSESKILGDIRKKASILSESYNENGTQAEILVKPPDLNRLKSLYPQIKFVEKKN